MSDQSPTKSPIQIEATRSGSSVSRALFAKFGGDINYLLESILPVGSFMESMLSEAQFQGQTSTGWVLADGRACAGSAYATLTGNATVPDARGIFLRGKNNGRVDGKQNPDGDVALGTFQYSDVVSHAHAVTASHLVESGGPITHDDGSEFFINDVLITAAAGSGTETRPRNVTANIFFRIN